jgi:hypothetical protein
MTRGPTDLAKRSRASRVNFSGNAIGGDLAKALREGDGRARQRKRGVSGAGREVISALMKVKWVNSSSVLS